MHSALIPLRHLADEFNCTIVFQHHGSKHSPTDPSGSNALAGNVDGIVAFTKAGEGDEAEYEVLTRDLRDGKHLTRSVVDIGDDGRSRVTGTTSAKRAKEIQSDRKTQILEFLGQNGETKVGDIAGAVKGRAGDIREACRELLAEGRVAESGIPGKKGENALRYRLPERDLPQ